MKLQAINSYEPGYPGCEDQKRWFKTWTFLWSGKITASVCLVLLLAQGPAFALEKKKNPLKSDSLHSQAQCRGKVAQPPPPCTGFDEPSPPPCRGDVVAPPPQPPPCKGEQVAPPPCGGTPLPPPPPCTGSIVAPPDFSFRELSLQDFNQKASSLVGQNVRVSGILKKGSWGNVSWDGFLLMEKESTSMVFGCPLDGSVSGFKAGDRVVVEGVVHRSPLPPDRNNGEGTVLVVNIKKISGK